MAKKRQNKAKQNLVSNHPSGNASSHASNSTSFNKVYVIIGIVLVVIIAGFVALKLERQNSNDDSKNYINSSDVAATITFEGEKLVINTSTVLQMEKLAVQQNLTLNRSFIIERLSQIEVLKAKARHLNLSPSSIQIDVAVQTQLKTLDAQGLDAALAAQNMTRDYFIAGMRTSIAQDLLFQMLFQQEIVSKIQISDDQLKQIYGANIDQFKVPESVYTKHILICYSGATGCSNNLTKAQANTTINSIYQQLQNNASFEQLAAQQSTDPGSAPKGGDLGAIKRGMTVAEFETVAFDTQVGQISKPFETQFGFHILTVYKKQPAGTLTFDQVSSDLRKQVVLQQANAMQQTYINGLMSAATVKVYAN